MKFVENSTRRSVFDHKTRRTTYKRIGFDGNPVPSAHIQRARSTLTRVGRENGRSSARAIGGDECGDGGGVVGTARALSERGGNGKDTHTARRRRPTTDRAAGVSIRVRCFDGDGCGSTSSLFFPAAADLVVVVQPASV